MGMRPSFDCRCVEADRRRTETDWKAGTRKDGSEVAEEESMALEKALPLLGESIVTVQKLLGGDAVDVFAAQIQGVHVLSSFGSRDQPNFSRTAAESGRKAGTPRTIRSQHYLSTLPPNC